MSIAPPPDFTTPYVIALLGFVIVFVALLVVFPSMRKYRRKRNMLVYVVVLLIIVLLVFQINEAPNLSKRAMVNYGYAGDLKYYKKADNQFVIACDNFGDKPAKFYINCTAFNASLQVKTEQDYVQVSSTVVKVPFLLQERGLPLSEDRKQVFFSVDENATEFEFTFWLEELSSPLIPGYGDYAVRYTWNSTENCFVHSSGASFT
jgi:membrane-bound acyltransferase YfiQ involved in biofilm formation